MFTKKELLAILSITLVIGTVVSLSVESMDQWQSYFLIALGATAATIFVNVIAKKITAHYFDSEIEIETWQFKRFMFMTKKTIAGHRPHQKMKHPFQAGFFMPLITKLLSFGLINWMACLTFQAKGTIYRTSRRFGQYQYIDITESEMAWISFIGIFANLIFATLAYMAGMTLFAKINLTYAFWNTIPISNLDGTKMFFGQKTLWGIAIVVTAIGLVASIAIL